MYLWNVFDFSLLTDFFFTSSLFALYSCFTTWLKTNWKLGKIRCSVLLTYIVSFAVTLLQVLQMQA